ncbi:hypothetical protein FA09DRAFT_328326 [Tilletiopsis washingtonensis]|uniref:Chromo domain-containing protein n=1 Tax=Tilletiopsis washingtonensis TaxID=58919 RepID=A0A316ZFC5_9BASI|nr:hypothetical protein FA09DRAFT_328326 [Tilletiopsis washingtonensis]PWO00222.1 hypothetical protein FA09DRAFT_328326 [Tilletiopsis washingtonensis]
MASPRGRVPAAASDMASPRRTLPARSCRHAARSSSFSSWSLSEDDEDKYEVERIRDHAQLPDGTVWYHTTWKGYSVLESTWESEDAFGGGAEDVLRAFRRKRRNEVPRMRTEEELFGDNSSSSSGSDSDESVQEVPPPRATSAELSLVAALQSSGQRALAAFAHETEQRWAALPCWDHVAQVVRRETQRGDEEGHVLVRFISGEHLLLPTLRAHAMVPQQLLRYYESCLRTRPGGAPLLEAYRARVRREKERKRQARRHSRTSKKHL